MTLTTYSDMHTFLVNVQSVLEQDELSNNLLLGICLQSKQAVTSFPTETYLATVNDEQELGVAVCMTPEQNILVWEQEAQNNNQALMLIAHDLYTRSIMVPGVLGKVTAARNFASTWEKVTRQKATLGVQERLFRLERVLAPPPVDGMLRLATEQDEDTVTQWSIAFVREALQKDVSETARRRAAMRIRNKEFFVWETSNGSVVSMAATSRPLTKTVSIASVYTPPDERGHGYASNCVAALSQHLLASGWQSCNLFTDLANPTSNSIYQKIGYRPVCDYNEYTFANE